LPLSPLRSFYEWLDPLYVTGCSCSYDAFSAN
jgi:hypothetical protein